MGWLIFIIAACIVEGFFAWQSFGGTHPFPLNEFGFQIFDHVLRDSVLAEIAYVLYYRRKRVPDRLQRYFPVIVIGILYLCEAFFMVNQLSLDKGLQTSLSVLAGINNNIFIVLLMAMCYHKWPNIGMKILYFLLWQWFLTASIFGRPPCTWRAFSSKT